MTDQNEHPLEFLAELALGVIPGADAEEMRRHVEGCELCRAEYDELRRVVAVLPLAAEELAPSPAVKQGVFHRISAEQANAADGVLRPRRWAWVAGAAAVLLGVAFVAGTVGYFAAGDDDAEGGGNQAYAEFARAVALGTEQRVSAEGDSGDLFLVMAPGSDVAYIWVEHLLPLGEGEAYQVWASPDGGPTMVPLAQFFIAEGGLWIFADQAIDSFAWIGVTIELEGDVSEPGGDPFVGVDLREAAARPSD